MTSQELAEQVALAVAAVQHRVVGVGAQQYDDGSGVQRFETLPLADLICWTLEEVEDQIAYAVMARVRLSRLLQVVSASGLGENAAEQA